MEPLVTAQSASLTLMAFAVTVGLVPALNGPARRIGLVDHPCRRKRHEGQIPLTGGLAMFLAFLAALALNPGGAEPLYWLLTGMTLLLSVGMLDDLYDMRAMHKLIAQLGVASLLVIVGGLKIQQLGVILGPWIGPIGLGPFSEIFTVACIVFLINAINMCDGMDGLAGGLCLVLLLMLGVLGWLGGADTALVAACFLLAFAVLGFLIYNAQSPLRERACVFMGDAGSMMLGVAIAWLAISMVNSDGASIYPVAIAWLLLVPAMDTLAVMLRRISQGRSPMAPDRAHLHHIILRCGFSVRSTVKVVHLATLAAASAGVAGWYYGLPEWLMFAAATAIMAFYIVVLINAHRIVRWRLRRLRDGLAASSE
jgi:UDP-GlcNAc:undecaprenyl-phosphate GlcNAc-1-phosphate transferase